MAGFFDNILADPTTAQGMQNAGTFGGLQALGAALAAAGAMRPVGAPGPGLADAFTAYGTGRQRGLLGAQQNAQMARQQARQGLLADARDVNKPDEALNPQALAMRRALSSLPENVRALADDEQLPMLAIKKGTEGVRLMTPEELAAGGFKPGSVVMVNEFTNTPNVVQASDVMSPEALAQKLRLTAAGHAPQVRWTTQYGTDGQPIAQVSSLGEYRPLRPDPSPVKVGPDELLLDPRTGRVIGTGGPRRPNLPPGYEMVDGKAVPIPGLVEAQAAADAPKRQTATANDLRGEYTKLTADFRTVQDAYNKIEMAGKTGQGDMSLLYSYMKILDPGSVVRESEFAMAAKTGSLPQQIQGWATRVVNGEKLPDDVRNGFKNEARNVYQAQAKSYMNTADIYKNLAVRSGAKPEDVVLPFRMDSTDAVSGGGGATPTARDPLGILK